MSRPLAIHRTIMTIPATPPARARPRSGARASARPPKHMAIRPAQRAKPMELPSEIWSPSAELPNTFELTKVMIATKAIASQSTVRWAASFSSAIRRFPNGEAATRSRLPRAASPASVPDSARIDQRAVPRANMAPYFQLMYPPRVPSFGPMSVALPKRLTIEAGMLPMSLSTSRRAAGGGKTVPMAAPLTSARPPRSPPAPLKARGGARIALPQMLPKPSRRRRSGMGGNAAAIVGRGAPALTAICVRLDGHLPVLGQEGLLERGLAAHEVEQLVAGGRPDDRRDRAGDAHPQDVVVRDEVAHARKPLELGGGARSEERRVG